MTRGVYIQVLACLLCVAAAFVSQKLLNKHITGSSGSAWFDSVCEAGTTFSKSASCAAVLNSPHSYWPPKRENEPPGTPHLPVAFLGMIYFSMLCVWLIGVGRPSFRRRWLHGVTLLVVLCGFLGSLRYVYVMLSVLTEWCPWCMAIHVMNLVIVVCVFLLWPRRPHKVLESEATGDGQNAGIGMASPRPSFNRFLATVAVMAVVGYANFGANAMLAVRQANVSLQRCVAAINRVKSDTATLVGMYDAAKPCEIPESSDDPVRASDRSDWQLVVFSDLLCPACRRFAQVLDRDILRLFDHRLTVIFKYSPLDRQCNPHLERTLHPNACEAAYLAAAVHQEGGNELFWKAHDLLFSFQEQGHRFSPADVPKVAASLNIDPNQLARDMQSSEVTSQVAEDVEDGVACGVNATPAVFLNGKRVSSFAAQQIAFWDEIADRFWTSIGEPRPESTMIGANATPDTQDQTDAP